MAVVTLGARGQHTAMDLPTEDLATNITDERGNTIPGELRFVDENNKPVALADYLHLGRPVILNLGYYGCPGLCGVVTNGLMDSLQSLRLQIGKDYEVVSVSIAAEETPALARQKKNTYLEAMAETPGVEQHWHFLTGKEDQIAQLSELVGFHFQWNPFGKQYDHSAGLFICSSKGVLTQVLHGTFFAPRDLRLALVEASEGTVGTTWDRILLTCYGYDPETRSYSLMVWSVIRASGGLTVLGIAVMIFVLWRRERRRAVPATS